MKRKITIIMFFGAGLTALLPTFYDVLIHQEIAFIFFILSFVFLLIFIRLFVHVRAEVAEQTNEEPVKFHWAVAILCITFSYGVTYISIAKALPTILHTLTSEDGKLTITARWKPKYYSSKRSHGCIYLQGYSFFLNDRVCGFSKKAWANVKPGDKFELTGKISPFGFRRMRYRQLEP